MQSRPRKLQTNGFVRFVTLNISRNSAASISTRNNNSDKKIVCPKINKITVSRLMLKQNLVEKSLYAIILNEYVVMDITNNKQNYSLMESQHYEPMYGRKLLA